MSRTTIAVLAGSTALVLLIPGVAVLATATTPTTGTALNPNTVPAAYATAITEAAVSCDGLPAPVRAAQLAVESDWNPDAVSEAGAQGLAQFMPATWTTYGTDVDGDGTASPFDPADAIWAAARYVCALKRMLTGVPDDEVRNMLAAYNAGPYTVIRAGGVPDIPAVQAYVNRIVSSASDYAATPATTSVDLTGDLPPGARGLQPNALRGLLLVRQS